MKTGIRKPSLKKSISARTTGKLKRQVKRSLIPGYGKKGVGILHPKKKLYNKIYNKTTFDSRKLLQSSHAKKKPVAPETNFNWNKASSLDKVLLICSLIYKYLPIIGIILLFIWPFGGVWALFISLILFLFKSVIF